MRTGQQIFDIARKHLLKQNKQCKSDEFDGMAFYNSEGLRCAVGGLMPLNAAKRLSTKKRLSEQIEIHKRYIKASDLLPSDNNRLLSELMNIHDDSLPEEWEDALIELAKEFNFEVPKKVVT